MESKRLDLFFRFKREDFDLWSAGPDIMVIKINSTWGQGTSFSYFYMMELECLFLFNEKMQSIMDKGVFLDACNCWNQGQARGTNMNSDNNLFFL